MQLDWISIMGISVFSDKGKIKFEEKHIQEILSIETANVKSIYMKPLTEEKARVDEGFLRVRVCR